MRCRKGLVTVMQSKHQPVMSPTRIIHRISGCVPIFFTTCLLMIGSGCHDAEVIAPTMEQLRAEDRPEQESWFTRFDVLDGNRPRVQIHADYMAKYENPDSVYMLLKGHPDSLNRRVRAYIFDEAGDSSAVIVSNEIIYYEKERRFESRGEVVVTTQEEKKLETEHLIWLEIERRIYTTGFVRITSPVENIQGYDLDADENLENYEIARVTGQSIVDDLK